ncbi:MAG: hypothetical protein AAFR58_10385 [Cyanobacteria bacterium J06627_28]
MSYSTFTLQSAVNQFGIKYIGSDLIFPTVLPTLPQYADNHLELLTRQLERDADIARRNPTDQAKCAYVIAPMLATLRQIHHIGIHTGVQFNVSTVENLTGQCDFLVTLSDELEIIEAPVLVIAQAKQSVMTEGVGRCVAQMVAAQRFNQESGLPPIPVFGCVTNGFSWRFLKLAGDVMQGDGAIEYRLRPTKVLMQRLYYTVSSGIML